MTRREVYMAEVDRAEPDIPIPPRPRRSGLTYKPRAATRPPVSQVRWWHGLKGNVQTAHVTRVNTWMMFLAAVRAHPGAFSEPGDETIPSRKRQRPQHIFGVPDKKRPAPVSTPEPAANV